MTIKATLYTDGGSRGNPGPAGIGYVLKVKGERQIEVGKYIGRATNNQAEYQALIKGVKHAVRKKVTDLSCYMDSELIVKQLNGEYRVKDAGLKPLFRHVVKLKGDLEIIKFLHVPREKNKQADKMVNFALDNSSG